MSDENPVYIVESDAFIREKLIAFLQSTGFEGVEVLAENPAISAASVIDLNAETHPIRVGTVAQRLLRARSDGDLPQIAIGDDYMLDTQRHVLNPLGSGGEQIRLTEKESALLQILQAANGQSIARDTLLEDVWDYAEDVETHTLETHIYRLRQKIEADSSSPAILMTDEAGGYYLIKSGV